MWISDHSSHQNLCSWIWYSVLGIILEMWLVTCTTHFVGSKQHFVEIRWVVSDELYYLCHRMTCIQTCTSCISKKDENCTLVQNTIYVQKSRQQLIPDFPKWQKLKESVSSFAHNSPNPLFFLCPCFSSFCLSSIYLDILFQFFCPEWAALDPGHASLIVRWSCMAV